MADAYPLTDMPQPARTIRNRHRRPVIGITGPDKRVAWGWWFGAMAVRMAGGTPVRLTPGRSARMGRLDGVIIGGGDDIDPKLYAGDDPGTGHYDPARDRFEMAVIEAALREGLPMLGICRGAQLINVVHGGDLIGDLRPVRKHTGNRRLILPRKTLHIQRGSRLAKLTGRQQTRINSLHHQAVRRLGRGLKVSGRDLDGIVQAIERPGRGFLLGTQWHPEYIPQRGVQRRLFQALVREAARRRV